MFFWNSLAFSMIQQILALWSLVPLPFLKPAWTSESQVIKSNLNLSLGSSKWGEKTNNYWIHLGSFIYRARPMKMIHHGIFDHCLPLYWIFILTNCAWHIQLKCLTWSVMAGGRQVSDALIENGDFFLYCTNLNNK